MQRGCAVTLLLLFPVSVLVALSRPDEGLATLFLLCSPLIAVSFVMCISLMTWLVGAFMLGVAVRGRMMWAASGGLVSPLIAFQAIDENIPIESWLMAVVLSLSASAVGALSSLWLENQFAGCLR